MDCRNDRSSSSSITTMNSGKHRCTNSHTTIWISIINGTFHDSWKVARIAPIPKKGPADDLSNYRPISVLPILPRLFKKIVYNQLYNYLIEKQFIYMHQSGFQPFHSVVNVLL